ncbi:hypothetical protein CBL_13303 [Carabus blaptoides fortunei]
MYYISQGVFWVFVLNNLFILAVLQSIEIDNTLSAKCQSQTASCSECMNSNSACSWCADMDFKSHRCDLKKI